MVSGLQKNNSSKGGRVGFMQGQRFEGSFENEDRSMKHSKTEHPRLENKAPKTRKWSTQISKPL